MATQFCQKCKQSHAGRACDYDEKGECAETGDTMEAAKAADRNATEKKEAAREK